MAIDTAAKQMSMLNLGDGSSLGVLPIPDGAYAGGDFQHLLDCYSGIAFDAPILDGGRLVIDHENFTRTVVKHENFTRTIIDRENFD